MANWKVNNSDFNFIAEEISLYHLYVKRLKEIEIDLFLATPLRDENGGGKSNIPGRPVENMVIKLFADSRILRLKRTIEAVEQALGELDDEKRRFVEYVFWTKDGKNIQKVLQEFSVSQQTYNRWKKSFVLRVGLITGDFRGESL